VSANSAPPRPAASIRRVDRLSARELDDLTEVLVSCVAEGASLGFHAPLAADAARAWWAGIPRDGVILLVAEQAGRIVGTVQLQPAESENGAHRGEVAKLLVNPAWRRQGIARALMLALEEDARDGQDPARTRHPRGQPQQRSLSRPWLSGSRPYPRLGPRRRRHIERHRLLVQAAEPSARTRHSALSRSPVNSVPTVVLVPRLERAGVVIDQLRRGEAS
jgi:GNAT superfamily N-acetyltransferase